MQGPTHFAAGILVQKAMRKVRPDPLRYSLVAFLAFLSHGLLDKLARCTYHPGKPLVQDWFWNSYHILIAVLTLLILVTYWRRYKLGLIFSVLPDLDWAVIHCCNFFSIQIPFWKEPILHKFVFNLLYLLFPPLKFLDSLPNWGLVRKAAIIECGLFAVLFVFIYLMGEDTKTPDTSQCEDGG